MAKKSKLQALRIANASRWRKLAAKKRQEADDLEKKAIKIMRSAHGLASDAGEQTQG
jgi:hypothetical protein